jgi:hypothetical protein
VYLRAAPRRAAGVVHPELFRVAKEARDRRLPISAAELASVDPQQMQMQMQMQMLALQVRSPLRRSTTRPRAAGPT